ncbi:MAG: DUF3817 domain-containing protein [Myxococcales bacterium]|nr:DUF3817 domain-containing protein [Myxococcales bacterium]
MSITSVSRLRRIGFVEGLSFLVLLLIAMPLKYAAGMPLAVKYVGWVHGALFVAYVVALGQATSAMMWRPLTAVALFVAAVVPGGTFVADRWLKKQVAPDPVMPSAAA